MLQASGEKREREISLLSSVMANLMGRGQDISPQREAEAMRLYQRQRKGEMRRRRRLAKRRAKAARRDSRSGARRSRGRYSRSDEADRVSRRSPSSHRRRDDAASGARGSRSPRDGGKCRSESSESRSPIVRRNPRYRLPYFRTASTVD